VGEVGAQGKKLVLLRVPVIRKQELKYVITLGLIPSEISKILGQAGAPRGWSGLIVDGKGNVVTRTSEEFPSGAPASKAVLDAIAQLPEGFYRDRTSSGVDMEAVYRSLPGTSGWSVHFVIPAEALNAGVSQSLLLMVGGGAGSLALAAALALVIARDLAHRRRGEEARAALALHISEQRGALALKAADLGAWRWELDRHRVVASQRTLQLLKIAPTCMRETEAEWEEQHFLSVVDARDRAKLAAAVRRCVDAQDTMNTEFRVIRPDGHAHWFRATGRALHEDERLGPTVYGVLSDIHASKQAHAQQAHLLRRLAEARESEQRRIAREIHDQIGQTVTGLALGLKGLEQSLSSGGSKRDTLSQLHWVQVLAGEVGRDLHRVAADLRPVVLDDLGLFKAVSAYAVQWTRISGVEVDVQTVGTDANIPPDVSISVYRCIQEGLTNVVKHAAAQNVSIVLELNSDELRVVIEDDGRGFDNVRLTDPDPGATLPRLGLSGIRERLGLVGGSFNIETSRDSGTALFFQVPLQKSENDT
jgi:signal transduction histidine kinase